MWRGTLTFERENTNDEEVRDYGVVQFISRPFSVEQARRGIDEILGTGRSAAFGVCVVDAEKVRPVGPISHPYEGLPVPRTAKRMHSWPSEVYSLGPDSRNGQPFNIRNVPLVVPDLPIVADLQDAISDWTGLEQRGEYENQNSLLVVLPDFRARIDMIRVGETSTRVDIQHGLLQKGETQVRAAVGRGSPPKETVVLNESDGEHIMLSELPESTIIFVTDRKRGDVIDYAIMAAWHGNDKLGVEFLNRAKQLAQLLLDGETETMEFKSHLRGEKRGAEHHLFIQSVVAFANTNGGTILVGVDDSGIICGVETPDPDMQTIQEWVNDHCEPVPDVTTEKIVLEGKHVIAVRVAEGENKPYQHKTALQFYVRRHATDRPARREELERIYAARAGRQGYGHFPRSGLLG